MKFFKQLILVLLVAVIATSCGGGLGEVTSKEVKYPAIVSTEMQAYFQRVEDQYRRGSYDYAFSGYDTYIRQYEYNELTDESYYKQGKIFFATKRLGDATVKFNELASKSPNPVYRSKAYHMSGYASFMLQNHAEALTSLQKVEPELLEPKLRVQFYSLVIESAEKSGSDQEFADLSKLSLLTLYDEYAGQSLTQIQGANVISYSRAKLLVQTWVDAPMASAQIPSWMKKFPDSSAKAFVEYKLAKVYYDEHNKGKSKKLLTMFLNKYPKNLYAPIAQKMLMDLGGPEQPIDLGKADYKVGVLLPLSGTHSSYGMSVLDGVKCAAGTDNACGPFSGIEIIVKDSGSTPDSVRLAMQELLDANVVAVVGPLSGELAIEAGVLASQKKIPIFPITQKSGLMSQGEFIYQVGMQPKQQIEALVKSAFDQGYKTFGVFYPNNNYGDTMSELFIAEIKARGGRITAQAQYNRTSPDPMGEVRKLKTTIGRMSVPGTGVGFDALFIPDSYQMINALVGGLEYNSLRGMALLGTNAWNDPGLSRLIATSFPGSFFVDLYDSTSSSKNVLQFREAFLQSFGRAPRVLEAYGYDVMNLIRTAASKHGKGSIASSVSTGVGFSGVTGLKGFKPGEETVFDSSVIRIKDATGAE